MVVSMSPKQKVYQSVLNVIRAFIKENNLQAGDKLPSERELAEKLKASRASIREALRSMELLGLIEVRHGGGTFISTYRPFHSVELLASFILLESNTKKDLMVVKQILEKEGAKLAFTTFTESDGDQLQAIIQENNDPKQKHINFFEYIFNQSDNFLLLKIWGLVQEFSQTTQFYYYEASFYLALLHIYQKRNYHDIEKLFGSSSYQTEHSI